MLTFVRFLIGDMSHLFSILILLNKIKSSSVSLAWSLPVLLRLANRLPRSPYLASPLNHNCSSFWSMLLDTWICYGLSTMARCYILPSWKLFSFRLKDILSTSCSTTSSQLAIPTWTHSKCSTFWAHLQHLRFFYHTNTPFQRYDFCRALCALWQRGW